MGMSAEVAGACGWRGRAVTGARGESRSQIRRRTYVGIKPSATGEDQILIATVPELDKTSGDCVSLGCLVHGVVS
jgi:hypothetical protein